MNWVDIEKYLPPDCMSVLLSYYNEAIELGYIIERFYRENEDLFYYRDPNHDRRYISLTHHKITHWTLLPENSKNLVNF